MVKQNRPLIVTSISPRLVRGNPPLEQTGFAYQRACIVSWLDAGAAVISVNNNAEILQLAHDYPDVEFIESIAADNAGKALPSISELLTVGKNNSYGGSFCLANSDVHFLGDNRALRDLFLASHGGAIFANRRERTPGANNAGLPYLYGFDLFIFDEQYIVPDELIGFFIGSPWWDYLLLYLLAARDVPLSCITTPIISHLTHTQAWSHTSWARGLAIVAHRIRLLTAEEGPAAALLGHLCRGFEEGCLAGFAVDGASVQIGTALGIAMVSFIQERCSQVLYFPDAEQDPSTEVKGDLARSWQVGALDYLG